MFRVLFAEEKRGKAGAMSDDDRYTVTQAAKLAGRSNLNPAAARTVVQSNMRRGQGGAGPGRPSKRGNVVESLKRFGYR